VNQKTLFGGAVGVLVLMFVGAVMAYNASTSGANAVVPEATLVALDRAHAPSVGSADAPVVIVEFLDPACETCAVFYPAVKEMIAANPGRIRVALRWAPFHNGSRDVVALLEAARKQDQFWPALERLLATQSVWAVNHTANVETAWAQLGGLDLDRDQILADMRGPEIAQIIEQDLADAASLNVTMTPEFFVNGRPLPSFGWEQLTQLVEEALAETSR